MFRVEKDEAKIMGDRKLVMRFPSTRNKDGLPVTFCEFYNQQTNRLVLTGPQATSEIEAFKAAIKLVAEMPIEPEHAADKLADENAELRRRIAQMEAENAALAAKGSNTRVARVASHA